MAQQINLFDPSLRRPKTRLSAKDMARLGGGFFALLILAAAWQGWTLHGLEEKLARLNVDRGDAALRLGQLEATMAERSPDARLAAEVKRLERLKENLQLIRTIIERDGFRKTTGYSDYFLALARQIVDGLWVTEFAIDGAGQRITMKGRSLQPELIPGYLQRLASEAPLAGTEFRSLHMARPPEEERAYPAPYVDFVVDTDVVDAMLYDADSGKSTGAGFDTLEARRQRVEAGR